MSTRGHGRVPGALLGGVAEQVLRLASGADRADRSVVPLHPRARAASRARQPGGAAARRDRRRGRAMVSTAERGTSGAVRGSPSSGADDIDELRARLADAFLPSAALRTTPPRISVVPGDDVAETVARVRRRPAGCPGRRGHLGADRVGETPAGQCRWRCRAASPRPGSSSFERRPVASRSGHRAVHDGGRGHTTTTVEAVDMRATTGTTIPMRRVPAAGERPTIVLDRVGERYRGGGGVSDLCLEVERGQVFGFLGPNGAGKSTTIRLLVDLIRPDRGTVTVLGLDTRRDSLAVRHRVGYLPGELALYERCRPPASCSATSPTSAVGRSGRRSPSWPSGSRWISTARSTPCPRAPSRRWAWCRRSWAAPRLAILDEPTGGLDPLVQQQVHQVIVTPPPTAEPCSCPPPTLRGRHRGRPGRRHPRRPPRRGSTRSPRSGLAPVHRMRVRFASPAPAHELRSVSGVPPRPGRRGERPARTGRHGRPGGQGARPPRGARVDRARAGPRRGLPAALRGAAPWPSRVRT